MDLNERIMVLDEGYGTNKVIHQCPACSPTFKEDGEAEAKIPTYNLSAEAFRAGWSCTRFRPGVPFTLSEKAWLCPACTDIIRQEVSGWI